MSELLKVLGACGLITCFFVITIMPNMAYSGYGGGHSCTGECYEEYVALNGTPSEIERAKQELANMDEFSDIRGLWAGCAACHGQNGEGNGPFPKLAGQSSDYIVDKLNAYKNREQVGAKSSTMWAQAVMFSDADKNMLGKFIEVEMK